MKKRKIINISYEYLKQLLNLDEDEFIIDCISESKERCSETILVKIANSEAWEIPEGTEIPRINWDTIEYERKLKE